MRLLGQEERIRNQANKRRSAEALNEVCFLSAMILKINGVSKSQTIYVKHYLNQAVGDLLIEIFLS